MIPGDDSPDSGRSGDGREKLIVEVVGGCLVRRTSKDGNIEGQGEGKRGEEREGVYILRRSRNLGLHHYLPAPDKASSGGCATWRHW